MDDPSPFQDSPRDPGEETEALARLLRLAGPRRPVPADREARLRTATHAHWSASVGHARRVRWIWSGLSLAAACLVLTVSMLGGWRPLPIFQRPAPPVARLLRVEGFAAADAPTAGMDLRLGAVMATGPGQRIALRTRDGATLRLDGDTRLQLLSASILNLGRGAIYVDSGSTPPGGNPLEIRTAWGIVRDVGTQFQVRLAEDGIQLSVREGTARLERQGRTHEAVSGTALIVRGGAEVATRSIPRTGGDWEWIAGIAPPFALEGRRLGEYLDWVGQETGLAVRFEDPAESGRAREIVLHGAIDGLSPRESLAAVLPTCGLTHSIAGDALLIRRAGSDTQTTPQATP